MKLNDILTSIFPLFHDTITMNFLISQFTHLFVMEYYNDAEKYYNPHQKIGIILRMHSFKLNFL